MPDFADLRERMIRRQIELRGIADPRILEAFRAVPREAFVSASYAEAAYEDRPLPIEAGQTISQPYIVALMIEAAEIGRGDRVLEVGAGSGYAAAVMSRMADTVIGIERQHNLVQVARERLDRLDFSNVIIIEGDGTRGCPEEAPFDAILAAASGSHVPKPLVDQLAPGGRLVMPIGNPNWVQHLVKVTKAEDGRLQQSDLGEVRFVPLIGEEGWRDG
ncbi:protein-L-isoaspartate(D-aspartate) O-methyltransferase [Sphingomonas sp. SM33]|uniref:Protein-L-isoaspartate O-methyltransferase n=1 Tax=Sphingomonas telluris TaxID=2907998 RepID=A0ABS9VK78_9SPHN|nr:protein-L-isoaspartate(D-aspartate) O-methyltransferase [Sphingomonas telluris]MCH8614807.1 protein-L-isoaspartate(D-aspartate) O-methyltransferase [Sphingomonas telluris]